MMLARTILARMSPARIRGIATAGRTALNDRRGVAAVEFALIVPILITLYLGMVEFSHAITADRKVTTVSSATADLVARASSMNPGELNNIFHAASAIMAPYAGSQLKIVVTSIDIDAQGAATVSWSRAYQGGTVRQPGAAITLPTGLAEPDSSLVMAEVVYDYQSALNYLIDAPITLDDTFYMRPRSVAAVPFEE